MDDLQTTLTNHIVKKLSKLQQLTSIGAKLAFNIVSNVDRGYHVSFYQEPLRKDLRIPEVATFGMTPMWGNQLVVWVSDAFVAKEFRGRGVGSLLHELRLRAAQDAGVRLLLCTVHRGNLPQEAIMKKYGWEETSSPGNVSYSNQTNNPNVFSLWVKHIPVLPDPIMVRL